MTGTIGDAALGLDILKGGAVAAALAERCRGKGDAGRTLSRAAAAQRAGAGGPRPRQCGDGCSDGLGRRSRQALRGVRRVGGDRCAEHSVVRAGRARCWRAAPSASRPSFPAATITRFLCTIPENRFEAFARAAGAAGVAVTSIGTIIAGRGGSEVSGRAGQGASAAAPVLQPFLAFCQSGLGSLSQIPAEIDRFGPPRRCARDAILAWSRRFEAALLGRAGLLFMRPPRPAVMAWGNIKDLRQIQ